MTPRERLRAGSAAKEYKAKPFMMLQQPKAVYEKLAEPRPWDDKEPSPYPGGSDNEGDGDNTNKYAPGEEIEIPPTPSPDTDSLNLRASLEAAAEASSDPDVQRAMRAIEARLAEIIPLLRPAMLGASKDMAVKLGVLAHII